MSRKFLKRERLEAERIIDHAYDERQRMIREVEDPVARRNRFRMRQQRRAWHREIDLQGGLS